MKYVKIVNIFCRLSLHICLPFQVNVNYLFPYSNERTCLLGMCVHCCVKKKGIGDNTPMPFDYFTQALTFSGLALIQSFAACFASFPF